MLRICILLSFIYISRGLTPPRIIYGGWTPILPGHPFYFGQSRRRNVGYENSYRLHEHKAPLHEQFHDHPVHNVEHHYEQHVQYVDPTPLNQYANQHDIFPDSHDYSVSKEQKDSYSHSTSFSNYNNSPIKEHQTHDLDTNVYSQYPPQSAYERPPVKGQHLSSGHKTNDDGYDYYPQTSYAGPHSQDPNKVHHISTGHISEKDVYTNVSPQSSYSGSDVPNIPKSKPISSGHVPNKNIFAYYPPQSAYDKPKQLNIEYKPVYFETPRKPLEILEHPHQHIPYLLSDLKDFSLKPLNLHDLSSIRNGGKNNYLKIASLDNVDPDVLKHIGKINFDQIHYLTPTSMKHEKYPVIKDSSGGTPKYPTLSQLKTLISGKHNLPVINYDITSAISEFPYNVQLLKNYKPVNNYKGTANSLVNHQSLRPMNPIETKKYRSSQLHALKSSKLFIPETNNYKDITILPDVTASPIYPLRTHEYTTVKGNNKNILSQAAISKNLANQMNKFLRPSFTSYKSVQPFYPKPILPGPVSLQQSLLKNPTLIHLPLKSMPHPAVTKLLPNYLNKNLKIETLYNKPSIITNIRGSPALVEREVAIIHVPVQQSQQEYAHPNKYPNEKEYLFYTASTPESTQVHDFDKINGSLSHVTLNRHVPLYSHNDSYTHVDYDYGGDKDSEHVTFVDSTAEAQRGTALEDDNNVRSPPYQNELRYIFVSSGGVHADNVQNSGSHEHSHSQEGKKQFFHAYYAPGDHAAPPGYVKMTVPEFNNLFKNAEIRYVDKNPVRVAHGDSYKKAR